jgi:hypothetical protein
LFELVEAMREKLSTWALSLTDLDTIFTSTHKISTTIIQLYLPQPAWELKAFERVIVKGIVS